MQSDLHNISNEGKAIVQSIAKLLDHSLLAAAKHNDERFRLNHIQIAVLTAQNSELQNRVSSLEKRLSAMENQHQLLHNHIDDTDQYERRDTLIISGEALSPETDDEAPGEVVVSSLNRALGLDLAVADINVAHRLGRKNNNRSRPIIVKLHSRMRKSQIVRTCIAKRPKLYANESLTPTRRRIYSKLLAVRRSNPGLIQSLYSSDGTINLRIQGSENKIRVTTEQALVRALEEYPVVFGAYHSIPNP